MCDSTRHRHRKHKIIAPPAPKALQRIKLADHVDEVVSPLSSLSKHPSYYNTNKGEENEIQIVVSEEMDEETRRKSEISEQDRLVEEILRKRKESRDMSLVSYQQTVENSEEIAKEELRAILTMNTLSDGSESTASPSSSSLGSKMKVGSRGNETATNFVKQRILYHGLHYYEPENPEEMYSSGDSHHKVRRRVPIENIVDTFLTSVAPSYRSGSVISSNNSNTSLSLKESSAQCIPPPDENVKIPYVPILDKEDQERVRLQAQIARIQAERDNNQIPSFPKRKMSDFDSLMSITENLCAFEGGRKKKSLKERYVTFKSVPGHPHCLDETIGYPECLPPGEIVRRSIQTDRLWGIPVNRGLTSEQLLRLMREVEKIESNDYVFMAHVYAVTHVNYHPYFFKIINYKDLDPNNYFTLSKYGVMHFLNGFSEYMSIVKFVKQMFTFDHIKKIPFFQLYPVYKSFIFWRSNIRQTKIKRNRKQLEELLFTTKRPLRRMLTMLFKMINRVKQLEFLKLGPGELYSVREFLNFQDEFMKGVLKKFRAFEAQVTTLTLEACRTYLTECGFSPDTYLDEVEFYKKGLKIPVDKLLDQAFNFLDYPGQWLPYSLQAKKKKVCERLTSFIHLVDYYVQNAYHYLLKFSVLTFMCEIHLRSKHIPKEYTETPKYVHKYIMHRRKNESLMGKIVTSELTEPIFEIGCLWNEDSLVFSPRKQDIHRFIRNIFNVWKNGNLAYQNHLTKEVFNTFTQPVVNGYMEEKSCGDGPSMEILFKTDPDLADIFETIAQILNYNLDACKLYVDTSFDDVRVFCLENSKIDLKDLYLIEDVQVLTNLLEKYHAQLKFVQSIEGSKKIGVFCVNNNILRDNAVPIITKVINTLSDVVLLLEERFTRTLLQSLETSQGLLDRYPITPDDYFDYLSFMDEIPDQINDFERDLDICSEIIDLTQTYDMEVNEEEMESFYSLIPLLNQFKNTSERQSNNRDLLVRELLDLFEHFTQKVTKDLTEIRTMLQDEDIFDPQSNPEKTCAKLEGLKNLLMEHYERSISYNDYQQKLLLDVTDYEEIKEVLDDVIVRHKLWESIYNWDYQRGIWDNCPFRSLDAEEMGSFASNYRQIVQELEEELPPNDVITLLIERIVSIETQIPLISNLHNPVLKRRHWETLEKGYGRNIHDPSVTLKSLNEETHIQNYAHLIQDVLNTAIAEA